MTPDAALDELLRVEGRRVVASLYRVTKDFGRAEDALSEAVIDALHHWPVHGVPDRPGAWLTTVARRRALDTLRRESRRTDKEEQAFRELDDEPEPPTDRAIRDDELAMIFMCCHPSLPAESRVALALRTLCGLTTPEIARAFLVAEPTMGQRISRAKRKITDAGIAFRVPCDDELSLRLPPVLAVINVAFTTGHHSPGGSSIYRVDLAEDAIRLARELVRLLPTNPECRGLLALLETTHARRTTRVADDGSLVNLKHADRARWDRKTIDRVSFDLMAALKAGRPGPYQIQAAISQLHSTAPSFAETDWQQIVTLYDALLQRSQSPFVQVNRAIALAELHGPAAALEEIEGILDADDWHFLHLARGDLAERLGQFESAREHFGNALSRTNNLAERREIQRRLDEISG